MGKLLIDVWPLCCLCILVASRWLVEGADPGFASNYWTQAVACALVAVMLAATGAVKARRSGGKIGPPLAFVQLIRAALGTTLILTGANLAECIAGQHVSASGATLALALTPIIIAILTASTGPEPAEDLPGYLWPGLAGLAGLLLLLPEPSFATVRAWVGLASMPMLTGLGAVLASTYNTAGEERHSSRHLFGAAAGCTLAASVFIYAATHQHLEWRYSVTARGIGLDASIFFLTLYVLRRLGPARWSAQLLLIPLLSLSEGLIFLRPHLDARSWMGLTALAAGAMRQLCAPAKDDAVVTFLGEATTRH